MAIGSITVSPVDPNTIYVGTGEGNLSGDSYFGQGVLKSTDAGNTWTLLGQSTFSGISIAKIVVDPVNPNTIYAGAIWGIAGMGASYPASIPSPVVYKSTDGGTSWSALSNGLPNWNGVCDLVIDPYSPNVLYAAVNGKGIYLSTNAGASWSQLTSGLPVNPGRISLTLSRANAGTSATLYAGLDSTTGSTTNPARVYKSTDGNSWIDVTDSNVLGFCGACWYSNVVLADPTDPKVVFIAGTNYSSPRTGIVFRSTDGGASWTDLGYGLHPDSHALAISPGNTNYVYTGNDGGVFYSPDRGGEIGDWVSLNTNLATLQFESVALHPTNSNIAVGGTQDNGTDIYGGSPAWTLGVGGDGGFTAVDFSNPLYMYSTYVGNTPLVSSDGGVSWNWMTPPPSSDRYGFYSPMIMDPANASVLYFGGSRLYRTPDRGVSGWIPISSDLTKGGGVVSAIAAAPSNTSFVYVGTNDGNVQMTTNLGTTWSNVTVPPLPNRFVTRVAVDSSSPQTAYVTFSGFNGNTPSTPGHVFKTNNSGASWTDISSNLPDVPANAIVVDPTNSNVIYVGTDIGVYATTDGGATWGVFGVGFPSVAVFDLQINSGLSILRAATHGRSIFSTTVTPLGKIVYFDDFSTYAVGQSPTGWTPYGTTQIVPTVQDVGGVGPGYQRLYFPGLVGGQTTKWLIKDSLDVRSATITTKLNFQSNTDEAGLSVAFQDPGNEIRITANPYWKDLTLIESAGGHWVHSGNLGRGNLPITVGSDYWLRVQTADTGLGGGKSIVASWSTDGVNFTPEVQLTGLSNIAGQVGYITWSASPPDIYFDNLTVATVGGIVSVTPTMTQTATLTPTMTQTATLTPTTTQTATKTPTRTKAATRTLTPTRTAKATKTRTPTRTPRGHLGADTSGTNAPADGSLVSLPGSDGLIGGIEKWIGSVLGPAPVPTEETPTMTPVDATPLAPPEPPVDPQVPP